MCEKLLTQPHLNGFFEIRTVYANNRCLINMIRVRSFFDYIEGFTYRDYTPQKHLNLKENISLEPASVLWYLLRKTPSPEYLFEYPSEGSAFLKVSQSSKRNKLWEFINYNVLAAIKKAKSLLNS
jgi:hypothetical protein